MIAAFESDVLTTQADWGPRTAALTDADSWEDLEHLSRSHRSGVSTTQGSHIQGTPEGIQQVYRTSGFAIVYGPSLPFGFTSSGERLPEFYCTLDRGEQAWTIEVGSDDTEASESSTTRSGGETCAESCVRALFRAACQETFEDGMENQFSGELAGLVRQYGDTVISILARLILSKTVDVEVASEALRSLGEMQHPQSYNSRVRLLERSLRSPSPWVRDGAALGLAWLNDPIAIPYLRQAIEAEPIHELRRNMEQVLQQLERVRLCR